MRIEPKSLAVDDDDVSAARTVVSRFAETWNRHDMPAMHELNTDDVEWINVVGNHWCGNSTVYKGHDTIHRTICAKTTMGIDEMTVRAIAPGVAIAVAAMWFSPSTTPSGEVLPKVRSRGSFVLVKRAGAWRIAHFQNSVIDAEAERNDPITWDDTGYLPGQGRPATR